MGLTEGIRIRCVWLTYHTSDCLGLASQTSNYFLLDQVLINSHAWCEVPYRAQRDKGMEELAVWLASVHDL